MAHEQQLISKKAWLGPGGPEGYLIVGSASLRWQPVPGSAAGIPEVRIALASITNNQRAKDKPLVRITVAAAAQPGAAAAPPPTHYVFAFESVPDRDAALDVLTKVMAALAGGAPASGAGGSRGGSAGVAGGAEVVAGLGRAQRQQLLARDPDLRALYDELVGSGGAAGGSASPGGSPEAGAAAGGVLSEAEFWGGVAARLGAAQPAAWGTAASGPGSQGASGPVAVPGSRRRVGLSNILQRVEAEVDGRHQRVLRVNLTPEQVAQIFAEQPAVLRAYRDNVPHRMGEEDFWRRYVRHEMHRESKRKAKAEGINPNAVAGAGAHAMVDDAGGDIFREAAAVQAAEAAAKPGAAAAKLRQRVDPTLDLLSSEGERYSGHGLAHAGNREPELARDAHGPISLGGEDPDDLASVLNRHGEVVLEGVDALARVEAQLRGQAPGDKGAAGQGGQHGSNHHHRHHHHHHHHDPGEQQGGRDAERAAAGAAAGPGPGSSGGHHHHHHHHHHHRHHHQGQDGDTHMADAGGSGAPVHRARRHSAGLADLHEPLPQQLDTLSIADPRRYFERAKDFGPGDVGGGPGGWGYAGANGLGGGGGGHGAGGVAAALQVVGGLDPGRLPLPPVAGRAAEEALLEATPLARAIAEDEAAGPGGTAGPRGAGGPAARDPASCVPPETLAFLRRTALSVNEACRHFWRSLPAHTQARREKAARLVRLLESKRTEVDALHDRARGVEGRFIRQLLKPPLDMLLAALVRWDEEVQKHNLRGGGAGAAGGAGHG